MNKIKSILLSVIGLLCSISVSAHNFEVDGIYYNITSEEDKTVEVTYRGYDPIEYSDEYSGAIIIPEYVTYFNETYQVTNIGTKAFKDCSNLISVDIPSCVTCISKEAFYNCTNLTNIEISEGVVSIEDIAFMNCTNLTNIEIPSSVTNIGYAAFAHCHKLAGVIVDSSNPIYDSRFNCNAIIETATNTLHTGCMNTSIPSNVTTIGRGAFLGCTGLTTIELPSGVTCISRSAFANCDNLVNIEIPHSVNRIEAYAFFSCISLSNIEIPSSVTTINDGTFYYCKSATSINIPNHVTSIGSNAFIGCDNLTCIKIPSTVKTIGIAAISGCDNLNYIISLIQGNQLFPIHSDCFGEKIKTNCILYVPYGAKDFYATTEGWSDFENIVEMAPTEYDFTISNAGYATIYLDYATEIPEGVEVYTAKEVDGIWLKMAQVEEVLPANTAAIVKAPAGSYTFVQTATDAPAITDNLLKGTNEDTYINVPSNSKAFVLSMVDGEVGMYLAKLTDGRFLNNANKAYLLLDNNKLGLSDEELDTSVGGAQLSLRFDFGGATGVDKVQTETGANNATYDMYGRKVNKITTPGLYIVNGKKVLVK
ncbi:MAG: leucine-rich repeat domain-containing protein [Bacteroidaceae bacterium]|nr:leucine-rich repeat domain-containing protein [Bacteroidaceae bacterium]